jgi:prepilin-type N-terminal cleavage/methylation domain-containing protein
MKSVLRRVRRVDRPSWAAERGDTLIEVLVAVAILGIAGAAIMGGFASSIVLSTVHRELATTASDSRNFAELLDKAIDDKAIAYTACAGAAAYSSPPGFTNPTDHHNTAQVTAVAYWNGTAFVGSCPPGGDQGVQRVSVSVTNTDTRAISDAQVIIRKPCLLTDVTSGPCP